jgi:AraC family transcriptional regulator of adaptative response/methylated-DNA-[protein]-cysteine methyltransferase
MTTLPSTDEMIRAYQGSDTAYNGVFYVAVRTTGIFCLPSCAARKPYPKNVEFFATTEEALFAGYRPCKRCRPLEKLGQLPEWANNLLRDVEADASLRLKDDDLRALGLDPANVRRFFLKRYGQTFQSYTRSRRLGKALNALQQGADLDDVALGYGYESHSGFREAFTRLFGQAPGQSREATCIVVSWLETPLGRMVAGATNEGICLLEFTDRPILEAEFAALQKRFGAVIIPGTNAHLEQLQTEITHYFAGDLRQFSVPLLLAGTPFQEEVWGELLHIPYGETHSYDELAKKLGHANEQRAVGQANGANRISILVPCHRVVNKQGRLAGYSGGVWRKQLLLALERGERAFESSALEYVTEPA